MKVSEMTNEQLLDELEESSQHIESANYETGEQAGIFERYDLARAELLRRLNAEPGKPAERQEGWVSVKERLPETFEQVLVNLKPVPEGPDWYPRTSTVLAWQKRGMWFGSFVDPLTGKVESGEFPDDLITHWRPLPAPPSAPEEPTAQKGLMAMQKNPVDKPVSDDV